MKRKERRGNADSGDIGKDSEEPKPENLAKKKPVGRPRKDGDIDPLHLQLCLEGGMDDRQVSLALRIGASTLYRYKAQNPEFWETIEKGKDPVNRAVKVSLLHRAMGYSHPEEVIFCHQGVVTKVQTIKHYPPDTAAMAIWLRNRCPEEFKDRWPGLSPDPESVQSNLSKVADALQAADG